MVPEELVERGAEALCDYFGIQPGAYKNAARAVLEAVYTPPKKYEQVGWRCPYCGLLRRWSRHRPVACQDIPQVPVFMKLPEDR